MTRQDIDREILRLKQHPIVAKLINHFKVRLGKTAQLLQREQINRHELSHQRRVVGIARQVADLFRTPEDFDEQREEPSALSEHYTGEPLTLAAFHDIGYDPDAHPAGQERLDKAALDYHPARGARIAQHIVNNFTHDAQLRAEDFCPTPELTDLPGPELLAELQRYTADWTPQQREVAIRAIWHHSNGSGYHRGVPLAAKVVRLADKLDMYNRVDWDHIVPGIRDESSDTYDHKYFHRLVPASIHGMRMRRSEEIGTTADGKGASGFEVLYYVDTDAVSQKLGERYTRDDFIADFERAYNKSMQRGAEVVQSLWEHHEGRPLDGDREWLTVKLVFSKGSQEREVDEDFAADVSDEDVVTLGYKPLKLDVH